LRVDKFIEGKTYQSNCAKNCKAEKDVENNLVDMEPSFIKRVQVIVSVAVIRVHISEDFFEFFYKINGEKNACLNR